MFSLQSGKPHKLPRGSCCLSCYFRWQQQGLLDIEKETWEEQPAPYMSRIEYIQNMPEKKIMVCQEHSNDLWASSSAPWDNQMHHLRDLLSTLHQAGLTANPWKCHLLSEAQYMANQIGHELHLSMAHYKEQVHAFLELAEYYCRLVPTSPL